MTEAASAWTCPFCPLLCDGFGVETTTVPWRLAGSDCPRALRGLSHFPPPAPLLPRIDGQPASLDQAIAAAARHLGASRQPLFGGLGTDVAGARALYRLAAACGAISDAAHGEALMRGLRALQDRGQFTTTLAEVRTRADLVVCVGASPSERYPEFFRRIACEAAPERRIVLLGDAAAPAGVERVALQGDLHESMALLAALVGGQHPRHSAPALQQLAAQLRAARYGVVAIDMAALPAHGELIVEAAGRLVAALNLDTRAALLMLGGGDGAATANQVHAWLSGLPLRTRAGALGLEHEPLAFGTGRLLERGAVDALLWAQSFWPEPPPEVALPRIVLGHAALPPLAGGGPSVFIPVATPGIAAAGHLFRTDGVVMLPLSPVAGAADPALPSMASVAARIEAALAAAKRQAA